MENDVLYNRIMNVIHEEYGEGSTAVANPEGEPTDDLTSIQIGDEIYGISGGGGDSGILVLHTVFDDDIYHLDQTYKTIRDAVADGKTVVCISSEGNEYFMLYLSSILADPLSVTMFDAAVRNNSQFNADSENDYPYLNE